jgi:hypothetical protein
MCDPLSRNMPAELRTIVANCLAHGRRQFTDVAECFPEPCRYVLEAFKVIYKNDDEARQQNMSPEARLRFHQAESGPVMEELQRWLNRQIDDRLVEPNSPLGDAILYLLRHWPKLTLFLHKAGAPLDNNVRYAARGITNVMPTGGLCRVTLNLSNRMRKSRRCPDFKRGIIRNEPPGMRGLMTEMAGARVSKFPYFIRGPSASQPVAHVALSPSG